jgi:hypothetical protein
MVSIIFVPRGLSFIIRILTCESSFNNFLSLPLRRIEYNHRQEQYDGQEACDR